jgi:hypothetical protein
MMAKQNIEDVAMEIAGKLADLNGAAENYTAHRSRVAAEWLATAAVRYTYAIRALALRGKHNG